MKARQAGRWMCVVAACATGCSDEKPAGVTVGDASATFDGTDQVWTLSTAGIEKRIQLHAGAFTMTRLTNKLSGTELATSGNELAVTVNGTTYDGATGDWSLDDQSITQGPSGSVAVDIVLHDAAVTARVHYDVWSGTALVEQYVEYENRMPTAAIMTAPVFLDATVMPDEVPSGDVVFSYFQGGRDTPDALRLLEEHPDASWSKTLESAHFGSDAYLQEVVFRNTVRGDGVLLGWSHASLWSATFDASGHAKVQGLTSSSVEPGASLRTPLAHTLVFQGDVDDAGNALKEWQYLYKWDFTHDKWAGAVKPYLWDAGHSYTQAKTFELTQYYRHVGADIWHWDDSWYDRAGDWNNITTADMPALNSFAKKNGLDLMVWMPVWAAASSSQVYAAHPDWATSSTACTTAKNLNLSIDAAVDWMIGKLDAKTSELGEWIWRQDFGGGAFDGLRVDTMHASTNYYRLMEAFKTAHPDSGINVNQCGGQQLSVEAIRYADIVQTTDLQPGHFSVYTPSYLFPPDKLWGGIGQYNLSWSSSKADLRGSLGTAWQWDGNGAPTPEQLEAFRENADLYHFMISIGVAGRFSRMYHPDRVDRDDPTFYVQRMNRDSTRGVIIAMHAHYDPSYVIVYPKGLDPARSYTVRFQNNPSLAVTESGAHWMSAGIGAYDWGGDLVWLNVENYPGAATDATPPGLPTEVTRAAATNLGFAGVEIRWTAAVDDNWISYYEVLRDGVAIGRSARAPYYFDTGGNVAANYEVVAVDGDGNRSPAAPAGP